MAASLNPSAATTWTSLGNKAEWPSKERASVFPKGWTYTCSRTGQCTRHTMISTNNCIGGHAHLTFVIPWEFRNLPWQREVVEACEGWAFVAWQEATHMMTQKYFMLWLDWFAKHVGASPENQVLLALDNHSSRMSLVVWK